MISFPSSPNRTYTLLRTTTLHPPHDSCSRRASHPRQRRCPDFDRCGRKRGQFYRVEVNVP